MVFAELLINGKEVINQTERNRLVTKNTNLSFYRYSVVFLKVLF